jgi:hypothetical protein
MFCCADVPDSGSDGRRHRLVPDDGHARAQTPDCQVSRAPHRVVGVELGCGLWLLYLFVFALRAEFSLSLLVCCVVWADQMEPE